MLHLIWDGGGGFYEFKVKKILKVTIFCLFVFQTFTVDVNNSLIVCNLVPATVYTVDVKLKPVDGLYYSNSSEAEFETCHMSRFNTNIKITL